MSFLAAIAGFDKKKALAKTETRITRRDGTVLIEKRVEKEGERVETVQEVVGHCDVKDLLYNTTSELLPWAFVDGKWREASPEAEKVDATTIHPVGQLKVVTYNVWFAEQQKCARARALCGIVEKENADVICLQEVTSTFIEVLSSLSWVRKSYICSDMSGYRTVTPYGVIILTRNTLPLVEFRSLSLASNMGRRMVGVTLMVGEEVMKIGTVHLESTKGGYEYRLEQIQQISSVFLSAGNPKPTHQILMGDMNTRSDGEENVRNFCCPEMAHMRDAWVIAKGECDSTDSAAPTVQDKDVRIDRIFITKQLYVASIERIGLDTVSDPADGDITLHASDHFGLSSLLLLS